MSIPVHFELGPDYFYEAARLSLQQRGYRT